MADHFKGQANIVTFFIYLNIRTEDEPVIFLKSKFSIFLDTSKFNSNIVVMTVY